MISKADIDVTLRNYHAALRDAQEEKPDEVAKLDAAMVFSLEEHQDLQNRQALAFSEQRIPLEVASWIHHQAGESVLVANNRSLAVRIVLTKLHKELFS